MNSPSLLERQLHFRNEVLRLLEEVCPVFSAAETAEVLNFVHHNENGEALCALAAIIQEEKKEVASQVLESIGRLSRGLVAPEHMPELARPYMRES